MRIITKCYFSLHGNKNIILYTGYKNITLDIKKISVHKIMNLYNLYIKTYLSTHCLVSRDIIHQLIAWPITVMLFINCCLASQLAIIINHYISNLK